VEQDQDEDANQPENAKRRLQLVEDLKPNAISTQ
jgi:hypothetical protein